MLIPSTRHALPLMIIGSPTGVWQTVWFSTATIRLEPPTWDSSAVYSGDTHVIDRKNAYDGRTGGHHVARPEIRKLGSKGNAKHRHLTSPATIRLENDQRHRIRATLRAKTMLGQVHLFRNSGARGCRLGP